VSEGRRALDAHAYVDGCLSASERAAFEVALSRDPRLRARVDAWRAQNEAMKAAFGAQIRPRAPTSPSNENSPPVRYAPLRLRARPAAVALAVLAFVGVAALPLDGSGDPRPALAARAQAALRAVSTGSIPLDYSSDDAVAVAAWLAVHRLGLAGVKLHAPGWTLSGVRLVPGLADTAALVVFEDALGERAGLWLERNDARAEWPDAYETGADRIVVSGASSGFDFAAVGPRASGAAALAPKSRLQPLR
jgi:anti-sigma factor RsiW